MPDKRNHKEVTIYDIARALDLSPATVSRGLKDHPGLRKETKRRILEAAQTMGYRQNTFARNLRRKHTNTIGVVVPRLDSYFMSTVIAGMEKVANDQGYNLIISQSQESARQEIASIHTMFNNRVDGLMVSLANGTERLDHFDALLEKDIPLIFFDRTADRAGCTNVVINNEAAAYTATQHLIARGCRRIAHLGGNLRRNVYTDRLQGYRRALHEAGLTPTGTLALIGELTDAGGTQAAHDLLAMDVLPDGLFAANDASAVACMRTLKQAGIRIPDDMAVVGFNNDPIALVIEPNLTTIDYPGRTMGEIAATTLIHTLQDLPTAHLNTIVLRHELIIRASSLKTTSISHTHHT